MAAHKHLPSIMAAVELAGRALARLETEAVRVHAAKSVRRLRLVSARNQFSVLTKRGKPMVQIESDDFAISHSE